MIKFQPMLAAICPEPELLRYPVYVSDKEDGIRCMLMESIITPNRRIVYSRYLKPIANIHVRTTFEKSSLPLGIDGELVSGNNFQDTSSDIMSAAGSPNFKFRVFDYFGQGRHLPFVERLARLKAICESVEYEWLELLPQKLVANADQLDALFNDAMERGKEGVMVRSPEGQYKFGRSTVKQQWLLKVKSFLDDEARVIGFIELYHNENSASRDARGYLERSSADGGLVPGNTLGALIVINASGVQFKIGTGFTAAQRKAIWSNRGEYLNRILTYKYQPHGVKLKPRAPVFLRWRTDL